MEEFYTYNCFPSHCLQLLFWLLKSGKWGIWGETVSYDGCCGKLSF